MNCVKVINRLRPLELQMDHCKYLAMWWAGVRRAISRNGGLVARIDCIQERIKGELEDGIVNIFKEWKVLK